ncbi:hypothetical protein [Bacillus sp. UNC322MFChir4.1]|uniref:hypothetical protein n=1 Tax=Bacillus sp. UNC322MFChir4.1 TaxID=1449045 RepID=UPI0005500CEF|nr:hypothetical protein [Bacillus sp. UNC322MFChir4.1]
MNYKKTIVSAMLAASLFTLSACKEKEVVKSVEKKEESQKEHVASDKTEKVTTEKEKQNVQKKEEGQIGIQTTVEELQQHIDKRGYILYTDHPIRRVTSENNRTTDISNYGDLVINIRTEEPLENLSSNLVKEGYAFITVQQDSSFQYKSWDEITNLERALVKVVYASLPVFRVLETPARKGDFSNTAEITEALTYLRKGGEFDYMAPVAQGEVDQGLFQKNDKLKKSWSKLANIENPKENKTAFSQAYEEARQETNNMIGLLNILLSKNYKDRLAQLPSK